MKTILRNFLSVLRRFRMAVGLNVIGLSVAFTAFLVIMMQVSYDHSFDRCHPKAERIFMAELCDSMMADCRVIYPGAFPDVLIASSPHIEAGTMITPYDKLNYLSTGQETDAEGFREKVTTCHPAIVDIFGFSFVEGDKDCLADPEKAIIPESMARRMFGGESAIGRQIHFKEGVWTKDHRDLTVGGVYRDFPENTQLGNVIYSAIDAPYHKPTEWGGSNWLCYLLLDSPESVRAVEDNFNRTFDFSQIWGCKNFHLRLIPFTELHYMNMQDVWGSNPLRTQSPETVRLLFLIAWLILLIAAVNYMNFSTALTPMRIRSINTQKVLGSPAGTLRLSLLVEAAGICLMAYLLAILWVYLLNKGQYLSFVEADIRLLPNLSIVLGTGAIALLVGVLAGVYPAYYITSFPPALVLKGSFGLSAAGRKLRTVLIGFQYIVSIALIVGACIIQLQNYFMRHYALGFDRDQIMIAELSQDLCIKHKEALTSQLMEYPEIEGVAFSAQKVGGEDSYSTYEFTHKEETFPGFFLNVSPSFLDVMGIEVTDGSRFSPSDDKDGNFHFIFNEKARRANGLEVGEMVNMGWGPGRITGFTGDVMLTSLREEEQNIAFCVSPDNKFQWLSHAYIRLRAGTDVTKAVSHLREVVAGLDASYPLEVEFYDSLYNRLYHREEFVKKMVTGASLLAILISIVGVFGLVIFETQYRRREIGIRKVYGASVADILLMFNRKYLSIVMVCFILATPVAYLSAVGWLENFAYRTPVYWWVFALAFGIIFLVTFLTVSFQNWRTANANPVDSVRE